MELCILSAVKNKCYQLLLSQNDIHKLQSERDHTEAALKSQISTEKQQMFCEY